MILVHTVDALLTAIDLVAAVLALGRTRALKVTGDAHPVSDALELQTSKKSCICRKNDEILEILLTILYLVTAALCLGATLLDLVLVAAVGAVLFAVADPRVVDAVKLVQALELGRRARRGTATEVDAVVSGSDGAEGICGAVSGLAPEVTTILICIIICGRSWFMGLLLG